MNKHAMASPMHVTPHLKLKRVSSRCLVIGENFLLGSNNVNLIYFDPNFPFAILIARVLRILSKPVPIMGT